MEEAYLIGYESIDGIVETIHFLRCWINTLNLTRLKYLTNEWIPTGTEIVFITFNLTKNK